MGAPDLHSLRIDRTEKPRTRRSRGAWLPWIVLLLLLGAIWLFREPLTRTIDQWRLLEVSVVRVERSSAAAVGAVQGTAANGYIVASRRAALSADTPGRIVELNVTEGSTVKRGEVVARLYSDELEAALRQSEAALVATQAAIPSAEAELASARSDLPRLAQDVEAARAAAAAERPFREWFRMETERYSALAKQNVSDQRRADEAQANLQSAEAKVRAAEARLASAEAALESGKLRVQQSEAALAQTRSQVPVAAAARDLARATLAKTEVRAPFDGIVVLKDAEIGEVVSPNVQGGSNARGSVVTMVDFASLEAQAEVPETTLPSVRQGQRANVYLDAYPDKAYAGSVARIWPTANRSKGTVEVRVGFAAPDELLRPEMGVRVVFLTDEAQPAQSAKAEPKILVAESCLVQRGGQNGVWMLEGEVVRFRELALGERKSGRATVESGLAGGELLVQDPPASLEDGQRVRRKDKG